MKIVSIYDRNIVFDIAKNCGSKNVLKTYTYLDVMNYHSKFFFCEIFDDCAFYAGTWCKEHFRLMFIAVKKSDQGKNYGKMMIMRLKLLCQKKVKKITLRTAKNENSWLFFKKCGGVFTGEKNNDFEMEIKI